jgi:histone H2B
MAKGAKKSGVAKTGKKTGGGRKGKRTWKLFIRRSLKSISKETRISSKAASIVNSFVNDMFDRIATEAAALARVNKRATLNSRDIQTAVRLLLPAAVARHALGEGARAVSKFAA